MLLRVLPLLLLSLLLCTLAACTSDPDRVVPPRPQASSAPEGEGEKLAALVAALDTLEALVVTLEQIQDPIGAWNRAADVNRLLKALERDRAAYALGPDEDEAARRYPLETDRLKSLEARRDIEMNRIMEDRVMAQVLAEEMTKAEAEAAD